MMESATNCVKTASHGWGDSRTNNQQQNIRNEEIHNSSSQDTSTAVELFHEESKNFWKVNRWLKIVILRHPSCHCLEVIASSINDPDNQTDDSINEHIYVDYVKLSHKISQDDVTDHEIFAMRRTKSGDDQTATNNKHRTNKPNILHKLMAKYIMDRIGLESTDLEMLQVRQKFGGKCRSTFRVRLCPIVGDDVKIVDGVEVLDVICPKPKNLQSFGDLLGNVDKTLQQQLEKAHLTEIAESEFRFSQDQLKEEDEELSDLSDQEDDSLKKWEAKRVARRVLEKSISDDAIGQIPGPGRIGLSTIPKPMHNLPLHPSDLTLRSSCQVSDCSTTTTNVIAHTMLPEIDNAGGIPQSKKKTPRSSFDQSSSVTSLGSSSQSNYANDKCHPVEGESFYSSALSLTNSAKTTFTTALLAQSQQPNKLPVLKNSSNIGGRKSFNKIRLPKSDGLLLDANGFPVGNIVPLSSNDSIPQVWE